ncbi:BA14K family protein [Aureimonas ureilytica]|uniref:BA14K family protein n=1 Tax=Aureimonas ureilytica TaxID=401562 RepID=UPI000371AE8E|nr:BA14K family protein [Aureimonas ureilytica]
MKTQWGLKLAAVALFGAIAGSIGLPAQASAGEFVGLDPYNRPVYARDARFPIVPSIVTGPHYRKTVGQFGGPAVAGPLYYATPAPPVPGFYRPDPLVEAGATLAFDQNAALARAETVRRIERGSARPAPFSGEWYRYCETRYRSFDRETGTFQPNAGPRRLCR